MEVLPLFDAKCKQTIEKTITFLEKQIKGMEEELASLAKDFVNDTTVRDENPKTQEQ